MDPEVCADCGRDLSSANVPAGECVIFCTCEVTPCRRRLCGKCSRESEMLNGRVICHVHVEELRDALTAEEDTLG
jgi:hypothetical protein